MRRFWGWLLTVLGIIILINCSFVGVIVMHLVPVVVAVLVLYWGLRFLKDY